MGTTERRQRAKQLLRDEILDAARELFAKEGAENVSMRKIAERIEYSPTAIYLHFKDKEDLMRALCEAQLAELRGSLASIVEHAQTAKSDPVEDLTTAFRTYVAWGSNNPKEYRLTFPANADAVAEALEAFTKLTQACIARGTLRKSADAIEAGQAFWAGAHGVASLVASGVAVASISKKKLANRVIESMLDGLRKR